MNNILDLNLEQLKLWMKENKEPEFRAKQVFDWIYKFKFDFQQMNNMPASLRLKLSENFYFEAPEIIDKLVSKYNDTFKYILRYSDNNIIEAVVMKHNHGNSICVSTQVGCRMGCTFCASTIDGVIRNLTGGEILAQILVAQKDLGERISHVVLMGSGEPLDNFENVTKFIELVNSEIGLNIGQRHITLSTCGIVPKIKELADKEYQITLAVSLHASNDTKRQGIMPVAKKYSIAEILEACNYYIGKTNKRITFEYALVRDVNDNLESAQELGKLLQGQLCHVNLIPVNSIKENSYEKPSDDKIKNFANVLTKYGVENTLRREMGADISAACGQLRRKYLEKN